MRAFPNIVVMAPADCQEVSAHARLLRLNGRARSIRYPKASAPKLGLESDKIQLGKGQIVRWGTDGAIWHLVPCSNRALHAAEKLAKQGVEVAVINPRFIKPLDEELLSKVFHECRFVLTLEEAQLMGGFGSAVLELANDRGWVIVTSNVWD